MFISKPKHEQTFFLKVGFQLSVVHTHCFANEHVLDFHPIKDVIWFARICFFPTDLKSDAVHDWKSGCVFNIKSAEQELIVFNFVI